MKYRSEIGGCLCFSCRSLVILTGCFSVLSSLITILMTIYLVINTEAYYWISDQVRNWLQMHQGDKEVCCINSAFRLGILHFNNSQIVYRKVTQLYRG